ncbi:MAG TPA: PKD domain-containing protein, partial [Mycobacteriales bacterium]|nr:PKD domain-containing protein [Mycobacteriales bacterium]
TIDVGVLPNDGTGLAVAIPNVTTSTLTMTVDTVGGGTGSVGLAEIEAHVASGSSGGGTNHPPTAKAGPAQLVLGGSTVQLDGSKSTDADGDPLTYHWTQTAGPTVSLSDSTVAAPTFTAPASAATLTFSLVVNDGTVDSTAGAVTVTDAGNDVAMLATATASSQTASTGQTADKAIDGVVDGYPGNYSREWATNGGGAGSWLTLTWGSAQTLSQIVLHDRPNSSDQITSATLTFGDGTVIPVGALPNDGTGLVIPLPNISTTTVTLTVTAVSGGTSSIGLAEIEASLAG